MSTWKARDPIKTYKERLLGEGLAPAEDFEEIEADTQALIEDARNLPRIAPGPTAPPPPITSTVQPAMRCNMREITFIEATREALATAMEQDPTIFVMGEGIGKRGGNFTTTLGLYDRFGPERLL
ncbi:MAG: hypothetical protein R2932_21475 [Caldilineaceae bacterium]